MTSKRLTLAGREILEAPGGAERVLLHSCCAPCAAEIIEAIVASGITLEVFFYNPNIHPREEYLIRKRENLRFCASLGVPVTDADYDTANWFDRTKGLENEPERGHRCTTCFDMRFERTAQYAHSQGYRVFSSTLGISRWKDFDQINRSGVRAASRYPGLIYWTRNWRKQGGSERMIHISKREAFYQQEYCGCVYSLRDTNRARKRRGKDRIRLGVRFYGKKVELITKN